jgi:hypothetical protein
MKNGVPKIAYKPGARLSPEKFNELLTNMATRGCLKTLSPQQISQAVDQYNYVRKKEQASNNKAPLPLPIPTTLVNTQKP